jgi:hypothetical protein
MLSGFWTGDPFFLKQSGLRDMYLFLSPQKNNIRNGYLVMINNKGNFISNQTITLTHNTFINRLWPATKTLINKSYRVSSNIEFDESAIMPNNIYLSIEPSTGTLTIYDNEKIYAYLYRDNQTSVMATGQYNQLELEST